MKFKYRLVKNKYTNFFSIERKSCGILSFLDDWRLISCSHTLEEARRECNRLLKSDHIKPFMEVFTP